MPGAGGLEVPEEAGGGGFGGEACGADVGDAVAFGVGAAGVRLPGDVGAEGVGRAEAGAFADEDDGELRGEVWPISSPMATRPCSTTLMGRDGPVCGEELREQFGEQRDGVALDGEGGEAVGDDDGEVAVALGLRVAMRRVGGLVQSAAEIGAVQVGWCGLGRRSGDEDCLARMVSSVRSAAMSDGRSSVAWTASRAWAWASWKSSSSRVAMLTPVRPRRYAGRGEVRGGATQRVGGCLRRWRVRSVAQSLMQAAAFRCRVSAFDAQGELRWKRVAVRARLRTRARGAGRGCGAGRGRRGRWCSGS